MSVQTSGSLFDACKGIQASDAAQKVGIPLTQNGSRYWAHCFLHEDKTKSMVFYDDGRFHCFSCKASGDAVKLYELFYEMSPVNAASRLMADYGLSVQDEKVKALRIDATERISANKLKQDTELIRETRINELLELKRKAEHDLELIEVQTDRLFDLVDVISAVKDKIYRLEMMTPSDLVEWVAKGASLDEV